MTAQNIDKYRLFDEPSRYYQEMLNDINQASHNIYLEIYRFASDPMGIRFRNALAQKCKEGVKVKILVDSWGTSQHTGFFNIIIKNGGEVRYFKKIIFTFDFFTKNHRRNHRKLLIIDNNITWIGSANISAYSIHWRELMLRLHSPITKRFKMCFFSSWAIYKKYIVNRFNYRRSLYYENFEIIQDLPSIYRQVIKKKFESLIDNARQKIVIETPYFLPGYMLRKALTEACKRGVQVDVYIPEHSDVKTVDLLRSKYLGTLHKHGIRFFFYLPNNLHAKGMLIDDNIFALGSPNFDYRSFRYQHEILLTGTDPFISSALNQHMIQTRDACKPFDYKQWKERILIEKLIEWILVPFRHLF